MVVFGAGNVGKEIARIGQAFGLETVGVNTSGHDVDYFNQTVKTADGFEHVTDANIIVNVLPETAATQNVFDAAYFSRQEKQPLFINVGRGSAIVDQDLIEAIDKGDIAYAALDVFREEPLPADNPFWAHSKIDVTPHMTGQVEHFAVETYKIFQANLRSYTEDDDLSVNVVSKEKGY
jgi:phosphoglycerate dehydrogenase-like enzyme